MNTLTIFLLTAGACMLLGALYYIAEHAWSVRKYNEQLDAAERIRGGPNGFLATYEAAKLRPAKPARFPDAPIHEGWKDSRPADLYKPLVGMELPELPWKGGRWNA